MAKTPKKPAKQHPVWKVYDAKDKLVRKNNACPKCGPGCFMAKHKDRASCGRCGYSEMISQK